MEAQLQIRHNVQVVQDYVRELDSWRKEVKSKEQRLREETANVLEAASTGAPVRARAAPVDAEAFASQPEKQAPKAAASHTYDHFSKWDKFNVDAALAHSDRTQTAESGEKPASRAADGQAKGPNLDADGWKARGNALFQSGNYEDAEQCYAQAIIVRPSSVLYSNRAMARLKLRMFEAAEQDCSVALSLDPENLKAYHRRGTARKQLQAFQGAAEDFEAALRLEPTNSLVKADRDFCLHEHIRRQRLPTTFPAETLAVCSDPAPSKSTGHPEPSGQHGPESGGPSKLTPQPQVSSKPARQAEQADGKGSAAYTRPAPLNAHTQVAVQRAQAALGLAKRPPKTSTEFEAVWRSLKHDKQQRVEYILLFNPADLPAIFKSSLTSEALESLIDTILHGALSELISHPRALELLENLTQVPRFTMAMMCIVGRRSLDLAVKWDGLEGMLQGSAILRSKACRALFRL